MYKLFSTMRGSDCASFITKVNDSFPIEEENLVPRGNSSDSSVFEFGTLLKVTNKFTDDTLRDCGVYPNSFAFETTLARLTAVSKNISLATKFAINAL